ncbi:MAG: sulfotransferase [Gemmatimonadota bacterium]|nr:sulfotransferase [Gemmatimonadota bacterium]
MPKQLLLFVCGTPRSGTTAMANLLNTNPRIVMGVERYGRLLVLYCRGRDPARNGRRIGSLFGRERLLFDQRKKDNKPFPPTELDAASAKYDSAAYVGDKVPLLFRYMLPLGEACPTAKMIYIVRDPVTVAASWQRRADNPEDAWPAMNGYRASVRVWNESVDCALAAKEALGTRVAVVHYDTFFADVERQWFELMDWLEIPARPMYGYTRMMLNEANKRAVESRVIPAHIRCYVEANACLDRLELLVGNGLAAAEDGAS